MNRITRVETANTLVKNPAGSTLRWSRIGSQGRCPKVSRRVMKPIARPNGVERPGSGIGVMKGRASSTSRSR